MKHTLSSSTQWGQVDFVIETEIEFPLDLSLAEHKATRDMLQAAFDSDKARGYASLADKKAKAFLGLEKAAKFSRKEWDDVTEAQKIWEEIAKEKGCKVRDFTAHVAAEAASSRKLAEAVQKWLASLPVKTTAAKVAEMGVDEIHAAIVSFKG